MYRSNHREVARRRLVAFVLRVQAGGQTSRRTNVPEATRRPSVRRELPVRPPTPTYLPTYRTRTYMYNTQQRTDCVGPHTERCSVHVEDGPQKQEVWIRSAETECVLLLVFIFQGAKHLSIHTT
ncbi:hypothetical protein E3U43_022693 [Larimichthys crocea]|uniref:Uncharacterized protein n=1 Tax=Larimichthys crocea TaxID=215358 RepID=A0ACD3R683_LARCR|nr:hypothetical protein E3U43_022693 [Larimichthys crocea]